VTFEESVCAEAAVVKNEARRNQPRILGTQGLFLARCCQLKSQFCGNCSGLAESFRTYQSGNQGID
jgi:hypothetical protein